MPRSQQKVFTTQRVTPRDIEAGTIRVPAVAKACFPSDRGPLEIVLKGQRVPARWDPRLGPDRARSGRLNIGRARLERAVLPNERLRVVQAANGSIYVGHRGSQLRIGQWVNERRDRLEDQLRAGSPTLDDFLEQRRLKWISPLVTRDYREHADDLWRALRLPAPTPIEAGFWPRRGPSWDAVAEGRGPSGRGVVLVEAKSHTNELESSCDATSRRSLATIERSVEATKRYLRAAPDADWLNGHYQVANRLAFLYYMRARRNIPTWLTFVYFLGDQFEVNGVPQPCPADEAAWRPTLERVQNHLGIDRCHALSPYVIDVFLPAEP